MLGLLKALFQVMGQGYAHQDLGEMTLTADKITQIEKRSQNYRLSGGQGRIVLIASTNPLGPAFDVAVDLSRQTRSLIEVLYIRPDHGAQSKLSTLLGRLGDMTCDFQMTFSSGDLLETLSNYNSQRQDIIAIVCSSSEPLVERLRPVQETCEPGMRMYFPEILVVDHALIA